MENSGDLILLDHFSNQRAIRVALLDGLALLSAAEDVAGSFENSIKQHNLWRVFEVAECEATLDALSVVNVGQDEEVHEAFVEGQEHYFVTCLNVRFDLFQAIHVDVEALYPAPHVLVKDVDERSYALRCDFTAHLFQLSFGFFDVERENVSLFANIGSLFLRLPGLWHPALSRCRAGSLELCLHVFIEFLVAQDIVKVVLI